MTYTLTGTGSPCNVYPMTTTHRPTWTATTDMVDPTAAGGYRRARLTTGKVTRAEAEAALAIALAAHVAETGRQPRPTMVFPGKTHTSCDHGAFHATGLTQQRA